MAARVGMQTDTAWGWVVAAGMSMSFMIVAGFVRGFGVFYSALVAEFRGTASMTSLIQGFRFAAQCISAPIAGYLTERFSGRAVVFSGAIVFSLGLVLSFFSPNLEFNVLTLGAITGVGMAWIMTPAQIVVGKYFRRFRSMANSICFCGSSLGMMAIPPVVMVLMNHYGLRGSLLIYGGFMLNCCVGAAAIRPIKSYNIKAAQKNDLENSADAGYQEGNVFLPESDKYTKHTDTDELAKPLDITSNKEMSMTEQCYDSYTMGSNISQISEQSKGCDGLEYDPPQGNGGLLSKEPDASCHNSARETSNATVENNDAFYSSYASLTCIDGSMYLSTGVKSTHSQNPVYLNKDVAPSEKNALCRVFASILDLSLFRNAQFVMLLLSTSFAMVAFSNVSIYIIPRAEEYGLSRDKSALLLTVAGGCDIVGRLCLGGLSDVKRLGPHRIMMIGLFLMGVATLLLPLAKDFNSMTAYMVVFGLIGSAGHILCMPIAAIFVGQERLPSAVGLIVSFHGIASAVSPPLLGYIKDTTGTYDSTLYVCGACQLLAGGLMLLEPLARKYDSRGELHV